MKKLTLLAETLLVIGAIGCGNPAPEGAQSPASSTEAPASSAPEATPPATEATPPAAEATPPADTTQPPTATTPTPTPPASNTIVWRGDFETGDRSQWTKTQMMSADRLQVVSSPTREGKYAVKVTVKQGDDPINSGGNRNELLRLTYEPSGSEYYYKWSTMFDPSYPSAKAWQVFTQWHHTGNDGSPPVEFDVYGEEMALSIGGNGGSTVWRAPLVRGQWQDFIFHVKWSSDPKVGFVELYLNGKLVLPKRYIATQFPGQTQYLKVGLYRNSIIAPEGIVYHDGWTMAKQLSDVLPSAASEPVPAAPAQ